MYILILPSKVDYMLVLQYMVNACVNYHSKLTTWWTHIQ